ncbi:hypothetical protein GCM10020331_047340 [Ectobacillus funiculus]
MDVMDGHFVPNITIGPLIVEAIRPITSLTLDVHLMIEQPDRYIPEFAKSRSRHYYGSCGGMSAFASDNPIDSILWH